MKGENLWADLAHWDRYDRVQDMMRDDNVERPFLDDSMCSDCDSHFGWQHACHMRAGS